MNAPFATSTLAARLRRETEGEVLFSQADRGRYATDASIYQITPIGILVPKTIADVQAALTIAREAGIPILPRGGGTSQCGQTVNRALVIDCSKHLKRILDINPETRTALVQPGLVLGHLSLASRSIWPGIALHIFAAATMDLAVLWRKGLLG